MWFVNIHRQSCFGSILKLGHIPNKEFWWHVSTFKTCLLGVNTVEAREQSLCGACCSIYLPWCIPGTLYLSEPLKVQYKLIMYLVLAQVKRTTLNDFHWNTGANVREGIYHSHMFWFKHRITIDSTSVYLHFEFCTYTNCSTYT